MYSLLDILEFAVISSYGFLLNTLIFYSQETVLALTNLTLSVFECCCGISSQFVGNFLIASLYKLELTPKSNLPLQYKTKSHTHIKQA